MTRQVPDSCTIDGRSWAIDDWSGKHDCVPSNADLDIETVTPATCNWAGRVDHFMVLENRLYLFKVEVSLPSDFDRQRIFGRRREVVCRYEPMTRVDKTGQHGFIQEWRTEYLVLDGCRVDLTGTLRLSLPYFDAWETPTQAHPDDRVTDTMELRFVNGELVE
jgi:hypothetical protein